MLGRCTKGAQLVKTMLDAPILSGTVSCCQAIELSAVSDQPSATKSLVPGQLLTADG